MTSRQEVSTLIRSRPRIPSVPSACSNGAATSTTGFPAAMTSPSPSTRLTSSNRSYSSDPEDVGLVLSSDFSRKYLRKGRSSASPVTSRTPLSPTSPGVNTPTTSAGPSLVTIQRMHSIKVKLQGIKERQEAAIGRGPEDHTQCQPATAKTHAQQPQAPEENAEHNVRSDNEPPQQLVGAEPRKNKLGLLECVEKGLVNRAPRVCSRPSHAADKQETKQHKLSALSASSSSPVFSIYEIKPSETDNQPLSASVLSQTPPLKTAVVASSAANQSADDVIVAHDTEDDEGVGITDTDEGGSNSALFDLSCSAKQPLLYIDDNLTSSAADAERSSPKGKSGSRFLTHPPPTHRLVKESGCSVDSNGLGSLSNQTDAMEDLQMLRQNSATCSADSHICSDLSETPMFVDVVADVTSNMQPLSSGLERKNGNRSIKHKSKSDPHGACSALDLPEFHATLAAHAESSPTIPDSPIYAETHLADPHYTSRSIAAHRVAAVAETVTQTSDESTDHESVSSPVLKHRRSLKKRHRRALGNNGASDKPKPAGSDLYLAESESAQSLTVSEDSLTSKPFREQQFLKLDWSPSSTPLTSPDSTLEKSVTSRAALSVSGRAGSSISRSLSTASGLLRDRFDRNTRSSRAKSRLKVETGVLAPKQTSSLPRTPLTSFPVLDQSASRANFALCESSTSVKNKRDHIVQEFYDTEKQYVVALQLMVEKYMVPLKLDGGIDSNLIDDVFYKVNEIYMHHATFLVFLERALEDWSATTTIGEVIHRTFSKQTVVESYMLFIENFPRAEKVLDDLIGRTSFQKLVEVVQRDTRTKLPLKAQLVKPAQRIPRYELLIKRLIENTDTTHPDYLKLLDAQKTIHNLATKINSVKLSKQTEDCLETLKKLELLLITDLAHPNRKYLRSDLVQTVSMDTGIRRDNVCIWLFTDLAVLSCIKRKSGTINRKSTLLLQGQFGNEFIENSKHKIMFKLPLEDIEVIKAPSPKMKRSLMNKEVLEQDYNILGELAKLSRKINFAHDTLETNINELINEVNKQLSEHHRKTPPPDMQKVDICLNTGTGPVKLSLVFATQDKRNSWENTLKEAKISLEVQSRAKPPEFQQALPITKTRAGMQFTCASATTGLYPQLQTEVWICNSDGYIGMTFQCEDSFIQGHSGHICLLSLQPDPIVTLNSPIPGCNSKIFCICSAPPFQETFRLSQNETGKSFLSTDVEEEGYLSDSSSFDTETDFTVKNPNAKFQGTETETDGASLQLCADTSTYTDASKDCSSDEKLHRLDPKRATMWLGTEDGCIHVYQSSENIKTTKNRLKIKETASVLSMIYLEDKIFASLANGEVVIYERDLGGVWNWSNPTRLLIGSSVNPVTKIINVDGCHVWCACKESIYSLNQSNLNMNKFNLSEESRKSVQCICCHGNTIWTSFQGGTKIFLYSTVEFQCLLEIDIASCVSERLSNCDDIIKQHKIACLRITSLLVVKELLWVGTSAGVILTLTIPRLSLSVTSQQMQQPTATALPQGHSGHVRFLTSVEMPHTNDPSLPNPNAGRKTRKLSTSARTARLSTKLLVLSGGDGYEDFRSASLLGENVGKDDSTNHLLLWQV